MACAATLASPIKPIEQGVGIPTATPLEIFELRCWARAYLWAACMLDLTTAVDVLQDAAERGGLIDKIGQDAIQDIIAREFEAANV